MHLPLNFCPLFRLLHGKDQQILQTNIKCKTKFAHYPENMCHHHDNPSSSSSSTNSEEKGYPTKCWKGKAAKRCGGNSWVQFGLVWFWRSLRLRKQSDKLTNSVYIYRVMYVCGFCTHLKAERNKDLTILTTTFRLTGNFHPDKCKVKAAKTLAKMQK